MATPKSLQSTCNCFKRLRISHTLSAPPATIARLLHTSPSAPARDDSEAPTTKQKVSRTIPSPLLSLRKSVDAAHDGDILPQQQIKDALIELAKERNVPIPDPLQNDQGEDPRLPRSVQALYLAPLRRTPTHGIPVANLQLRSYSVRNLEFMADFALRAAYYLDLPAKGPVPLPRITERWTIPRDVFIFKKSMENWERITMRRLIQIQDGHPEVVQRWLAFVRKWCWYGVGMKANVWEHEGMDVVDKMDKTDEDAMRAGMEGTDWDLIGRRRGLVASQDVSKHLTGKGFGPIGSGQEGPKRSATASTV